MTGDERRTAEDLVEELLRYHVLTLVFEMDPERWLRYLEEEGSHQQLQADRPFVEWARRALERDELLREKIAMLVATSSELLFTREGMTV
jgi:hypothetical protein